MEPWTDLGFATTPEVAWESLVRRYGAGLTARVRRALRRAGVRPRREQVEEIVQEVYCRLLAGNGSRLRQCRATSVYQLGAFLGTVAERVAFDHVRASRAQKRGGEAQERAERAQSWDHREGRRQRHGDAADRQGLGDSETQLLVDPGANPEERLLRRESVRRLLEQCGALAGPRQLRRNVRILALAWSGRNSHEIARLLGGQLTPRGIDSLLRRIRRRAAASRLRPSTEQGL